MRSSDSLGKDKRAKQNSTDRKLLFNFPHIQVRRRSDKREEKDGLTLRRDSREEKTGSTSPTHLKNILNKILHANLKNSTVRIQRFNLKYDSGATGIGREYHRSFLPQIYL